MKRSQITSEMRDKLNPEDQVKLFGLPIAPAKKKQDPLERQEHRTFYNWLLLNGYAFAHSRTDRPTTQNLGVPDFLVFSKDSTSNPAIGQALAFEFKCQGNTLSKEQQEWRTKYGAIVNIVSNAGQAIDLVRIYFQSKKVT